MAKRRSWDSLTVGYRNRLESAGRRGVLSGRSLSPAATRAYYERGGDLRAARGHHPAERRSVPRGAAPTGLVDAASLGRTDAADDAALRAWRRTAPPWIPRSRAHMGDDTAAILSRIPRPPSEWKRVEFMALPEGRYRMVVTFRHGGYPATVVLPDFDAKSEVGRLVNPHSRPDLAASQRERDRLRREWTRRGDPYEITVDDYGTDPKAAPGGAPPTLGPPPSGPGAFPDRMPRNPTTGRFTMVEPMSVGRLFAALGGTPARKRTPRTPKTRRAALVKDLGVGDLLDAATSLYATSVAELDDTVASEVAALRVQIDKVTRLLGGRT